MLWPKLHQVVFALPKYLDCRIITFFFFFNKTEDLLLAGTAMTD